MTGKKYPQQGAILFFCYLILLFISHKGKAQSTVSVMSLQDCIAYALEHNNDVGNAQLAVETAKRQQQEALGTGLPQISAEATLEQNLILPVAFFPAIIVGGPEGEFIPVELTPKYVGRGSLKLEQMIFSGSFFVALKASRAYTASKRLEKGKTEIDVIEAVSKAYYRVLVTYEQEQLVEKTYQRLDSLLAETKIMNEAGFVEQADVDRLRVQFNNAKVERDNFEQGLDMSYALLKFEMGMSMDTPLQVSERISDIQFTMPTMNAEEDFGYEKRIDYKVQQSAIGLTKLDIQNSRSKYLPKIDLYANYGANNGSTNLDDFMNFGYLWRSFGTIGLRFSLPIFDGLQKTRAIQQKQIQLRKLENGKENLERAIDLQIQQAKTKWKKSIEKMEALRKNTELAENVYRATVLKYESGLGSNSEVVNADAALTEAQTNYNIALYDVLIAKVDLDKAYGNLIR